MRCSKATILRIFGPFSLATPAISTDDFRRVFETETAANDNFIMMKNQEHRNLQDVWRYELPPWWEYLQLNEGINLRRCCFKSRQFPAIVCFFGNQRCSGIGQEYNCRVFLQQRWIQFWNLVVRRCSMPSCPDAWDGEHPLPRTGTS